MEELYADRRKATKSYRPKSYVRTRLVMMFATHHPIDPSSRFTYHPTFIRPGTSHLDIQQMSPGLMRARAPYKVPNVITGVALACFATGAWIYAMNAVKQDTFEDVDEEAKSMIRTGVKSLEDEEREKLAKKAGKVAGASAELELAAPVVVEKEKEVEKVFGGKSTKGVLAELVERKVHKEWKGKVLDPRTKTLVWGAPPVDRFGRIGDRES